MLLRSLLILLACLSLTFAATPAQAQPVQLAWDAPLQDNGTPIPNLAGYRLYYGSQSGQHPTMVYEGLTTAYTMTNVSAGQTYYFAVKAYDSTNKESAFSNEVSVTLPTNTPVAGIIPQQQMRVVSVDSQELVGEHGAVTNAIDGNPATFWHTEWYQQTAPLPHTLVLDLGGQYQVDGFRYLPRQDGSPNGTIAGYEFSVSPDGSTWDTAVATGTLAANTSEKTVRFTAKPGRYVRLVALSEMNGYSYTSAAELNVFGTIVTPKPSLTLSAAPATLASGQTATVTWAATNATTCAAPWTASTAPASSQAVKPTTTTTYTMTCSGAGGTATASTVVTVTPKPSLTLSAAPATLASGQTATVTWAATNATTCAAPWTASTAPASSQAVKPTTTTTYTMTCSGAGGTATASTVVTVTPKPSLTLSAAPATLASGQTATVTWAATNATTCAAPWTASTAPASSQAVKPTTTTTYTMTCSGAGGTATASTVVTVTPKPSLTLSAAPATLASGQTATVTWAATNATTCAAPWTASTAPASSQAVKPTTTTTYTMTCSGAGGTATASTVVTVTPKPSLTLSAAPATLASGQTATVTWAATNATTCAAPWTASTAPASSQAVKPTTTTTYTMTCSGAGGTATASTVVTVTPKPSLTLSAAPATLASGQTATVTWAATNATTCAAPWTASTAPASSQAVKPTTTTTYTMTCSGAGGTATASTTVSMNTPVGNVIPQQQFRVVSVDSQELVGEHGAVTNAIDGNPATFWHTEWYQQTAPLPHTLVLDLGGQYQVDGFRYLPRQDGSPNGTIAGYEFSVSPDGSTWDTAVATGTLAANTSEKTVRFTAKPGRYVRLVALSEMNGYSYTSAAELNVFGTIVTPKPSLTLSAAPATLASGQTATVTWAATNATTCAAPWTASTATASSQAVKPTTTTTYTMTCTGTGGTATASTVVTVTPKPGLTLSALPATLASGQTATVTWAATNATTCAAPWTASTATASSQAVKPTTTTTYTMTCTGTGGTATASTVVTVTPKPSLTLSALPATLASGQTATVTWAATNATTCAAPWTASTATASSQAVKPTTTTTYTMTCTGTGGTATASTVVTVTPKPGLTLSALPATLASGQTATVTWAATNATTCAAPWTASTATASSQAVKPTTTTTYTMTCTGTGGTATASTVVTVTPKPSLTLSAAPATLASGQTATVTWAATNATTCAAPWTASTATASSQAVKPTTTTTYTMTCTGTGGTATASTTVSMNTLVSKVIPQQQFRVVSVDSQELVGEHGAVTNAIDGNPATFWHTEWYQRTAPLPHTLVLDLGGQYQVDGFRYLPRQDGDPNGTMAGYQFSVSPDGTTWGTAVAAGTLAADATEKTVRFPAKSGRYVRLVALSEMNGNPWTSAAELNVFGTAVPSSTTTTSSLLAQSVTTAPVTSSTSTSTTTASTTPQALTTVASAMSPSSTTTTSQSSPKTASAMALSLTSVSPTMTVSQNTRWELPLTSTKTYANPFLDVTVTVEYTKAGAPSLHGYGFWDGDATFKLRQAFPEPGTWHYKTTATDPSNSGLHNREGEVQVLPYSGPNPLYRHGFLQVSADRRFFTHADGTPFLWLGDTLWGATVWLTEAGFHDAVADRRAKHFTVLQTNVAREDEVDTAGDTPWQDDRWNVRFMQKLDRMFSDANDQGMYLFVNGLVDLFWDRGMPNYERLVEMIGARYAAHFVSFASSMDDPYDPLHEQLNAAIQRTAPRTLVAQHPGAATNGQGPVSTAEQYYDTPFVDYVMDATGGEGDLEVACKHAIKWSLYLYNHVPPKPVINGAAWYEGVAGGTAEMTAQLGYLSLLSGNAGYTYGTSLWNATDADIPAWQAFRGATYMQYLYDFFAALDEGRPFQPRHGLIKNQATRYQDRMVLGVSADGMTYTAFLPKGGTISVDLKALVGTTVGVTWYNPLTGQYHDQGTTSGGAVRSFVSPFGTSQSALVLMAQ